MPDDKDERIPLTVIIQTDNDKEILTLLLEGGEQPIAVGFNMAEAQYLCVVLSEAVTDMFMHKLKILENKPEPNEKIH